MNLWSLHAYFVDGLAYAAESLVGKDFGRGSPAALRATVHRLMFWGVGVSLMLSGVYALAGREILGVFTDKSLVIEAALGVFAWTIIMPPINGVAFVWDGVYLGATRTRALRDAMLICCGLVFLPAVFLCEHFVGGPHDLWMALSIWEVSRVVILGRWAEREVYRAP
jgi:MATE family multidrug resistance protein